MNDEGAPEAGALSRACRRRHLHNGALRRRGAYRSSRANGIEIDVLGGLEVNEAPDC
jgi:hypothetical protein